MAVRNRVAIIGRPNVGKSTLFNVISETRRAVVKDRPGTTRDIQILPANWCGIEFDVIDTGGLTDAKDTFSPLIREQVMEVIKTVHALVVVMDGRAGLCPEDQELFRIASQSGRPFVVVLNKVDSPDLDLVARSDFYQLGVELFTAAFEKRWGVDMILDWAVKHFPKESEIRPEQAITLSILGKPNAGKSSLVNKLCRENRMLVSEVAGTTVDAVDTDVVHNGKIYTIIDTAGVRRRAKQTDDLEILGSFKSMDAVRRANLVLLVIDGASGPAEQDARLLEAIVSAGKGVIVVANKVDLSKSEKPEFRKEFREQAARIFHFFEDVPLVFTSALTGTGIIDLFNEIDKVWEKMNKRITTRKLNDFFFEVIRQAPAPVWGVKDVKFYYLVQTNQVPPSFIAFTNFPDGVDNAYRRFLAKRIKAEWGLEGIPVRIYAMKRGGRRLSATPVAEGHKEQEIPEAQDLDFEIPMDIPDEFIGESAPL